MMVVFGAMNGLGFLLIGEACAVTSQRSYVGAWRETIGQGTSFILAVTLPQREVILTSAKSPADYDISGALGPLGVFLGSFGVRKIWRTTL